MSDTQFVAACPFLDQSPYRAEGNWWFRHTNVLTGEITRRGPHYSAEEALTAHRDMHQRADKYLAQHPEADPARRWPQAWKDVIAERERARAKHGLLSIDLLSRDSASWLPILMEEVGEVATAMLDQASGDPDRPGNLRDELVQVLAVASAWVDAIDNYEEPEPRPGDPF